MNNDINKLAQDLHLDNLPIIPKNTIKDNVKKLFGPGRKAVTFASLIVIAVITLTVALVSFNLRNKSLSPLAPESNPDAGSAACRLNLTLPTPTPTSRPTLSPTPSPTSSICNVSFNLPDQAVCWFEPRSVPIRYTVHSLPSGGPYYMQTDWYLAAPRGLAEPTHHYTETQQIEAGHTYTVTAQWPGVDSFNPRPTAVEIHAGLNVVDSNHNLLTPNCTGGIDYYWTPYVNCPAVTPRPTATPTPAPQCSREWCMSTYDLVPRQ